jgi:hypothetical protein
VKLAIDEDGDVYVDGGERHGELVIQKRYGYDSEDSDVLAAMVEAYNQREAKS